MKTRRILYLSFVLLALCLWFFGNGTGSRAVLFSALLLPLCPPVRHGLFAPDKGPALSPHTVQAPEALSRPEEEDSGDVHPFRPGDEARQIHWKLSAKRGTLLVREQAPVPCEAEESRTVSAPLPRREVRKRRLLSALLAVIPLAVLCLLLLPAANRGARLLFNRLFEASEAKNAYLYDRFPVEGEGPLLPAALLLASVPGSLLAVAVLSGSRLPALLLYAGCVLFQVWFGLAFPAWVNIGLCGLLLLRLLRRPPDRRAVLALLAVLLVLSLLTALLWPGTDASVEAASEKARDALSRMADSIAGAFRESPAGDTPARHVHTRSLTEGDAESREGKGYRPVTVEEEEISLHRWADLLRSLALLLLTVALIVLPFLPFLWFNARRKKALQAREVFRSGQVGEAVCALFLHTVRWLDACGCGPGNAPYAAWTPKEEGFPEGYPALYRQCAALFEEAAYSGHSLGEDARQTLLALLARTEETLKRRAGWKQRFLLKYRECLWTEDEKRDRSSH